MITKKDLMKIVKNLPEDVRIFIHDEPKQTIFETWDVRHTFIKSNIIIEIDGATMTRKERLDRC